MACFPFEIHFGFSLIVLLLSTVFGPRLVTSSENDEVATRVLQKEAEYHIGELSRLVDRLESNQAVLSLSADACRTLTSFKAQLFQSCTSDRAKSDELTTFKELESGTEGSEETDVDIVEFNGKDHPSKWKLPDLHLISVDAERRNDDDNHNITETHLTFNISHSSQAFVVRTDSFNFIKKTIGAPGKYGGEHITSTVPISVDSSNCIFGPGPTPKLNEAIFVFGLVVDTSLTVTARVDLCRFNQRLEQFDRIHGIWNWVNVSQSLVSEKIIPATFRVLNASPNYYDENTNEILITPGENPQFDMDIFYPDLTTAFKIVPRLWNWETERLIQDGQVLYIDPEETDDDSDRFPLDYDMDRFPLVYDMDRFPLVYSIIKKEVLNNESKGDDQNDQLNVALRVRVTVDFGSNKKSSGKLLLLFAWVNANLDEQQIVRETWTKSYLSLRLPYKISVFPNGMLLWMHMRLRSSCESVGTILEEEEKEEKENHRNCIITCAAEGHDIASIFVVKKSNPYVPPAKSVSYVINRIDAMSKMFLTGSFTDVDGDYQCVVVTEDGRIQTRQDTILTHGRPTVQSITVEEHGTKNKYSLLKCVAFGIRPMTLSFSLVDKDGRGLQISSSRVESPRENKTTHSVEIKTEKLLFPTRRLACDGLSGRGNDREEVDLSLHVKNYNRTAPIVLQEEFRIEIFPNGTNRISCTATGGKKVEIQIAAIGIHGFRRLDNRPEMVRATNVRGDRKTVVLDVPTENLPYLDSRMKIYCDASNKRGMTSKRMRFDKIVRIKENEDTD